MSERASRRETPLVRFDLPLRALRESAGAGVICGERRFLGHINLRGSANDARFVASASEVAGAALPITPNTVSRGNVNVVYWLGPNEWLVVTPTDGETDVLRELRAALAGMFAAVTEVSGGQTVITLRGVAVRALLAKGCPLDLHPRAFGVARCAQSRLAKAPILVHQVDERPAFEIIVRRSFADYLWSWLEDAASEYGLAIEASGSVVTALGTKPA